MDKDDDGDIDAKDLKKLRKEGVAEAEKEVEDDGETEKEATRQKEDVAAFTDAFNKISDMAKNMKLDLEPEEDEDMEATGNAAEEDAEVEQGAETEPEPTQ